MSSPPVSPHDSDYTTSSGESDTLQWGQELQEEAEEWALQPVEWALEPDQFAVLLGQADDVGLFLGEPLQQPPWPDLQEIIELIVLACRHIWPVLVGAWMVCWLHMS